MSNDSHHSHHEIPQSATSYRSNNQAPILIAPNPLSFRPATKEGGPYRQNSNQSSQSTSQTSGPTRAYPEPLRSLAPGRGRRNQKRKSPPRTLHEDIIQSGELSAEEQLLIQLAERDNLPWKEVAAKFNKATGKDMKIAALQMRKKRLIERLRVWTEEEVVLLPHYFWGAQQNSANQFTGEGAYSIVPGLRKPKVVQHCKGHVKSRIQGEILERSSPEKVAGNAPRRPSILT